MEKEIKVGVHNRFDFVRRDAKTGEVLGEYKAENIILNTFWPLFLSSNSRGMFSYIIFGSGTSAPLPTDTRLTQAIASKLATPVYADNKIVVGALDYSLWESDGIIIMKKSVRIEDTEHNGTFISEVGLTRYSGTTSDIITKALVKDMNGNVVSIEKKPGEVLDIFARVYLKVPLERIVDHTIVHSGSSFLNRILTATYSSDMIDEAAYIYSGSPNRGQLELKNAIQYAAVIPTVSIPDKKITFSMANLTASNGNALYGIKSLELLGIRVKLPTTGFTQPPITKEVVGTGDGVTKDFRTAFGYILDNDTCKVYVNDVEVSSGVSIDFDKPVAFTNIVDHMIIVEYPPVTDEYGKLVPISPGFSNYLIPWYILENPWASTIPVTQLDLTYGNVEASNDLVSWVTVGSRSSKGLVAVASGYQNHRYWRFNSSTTSGILYQVITSSLPTNIHLDTAPAVGDTVAVTYQPDCIAKDAQHVLNNVKITFSFNEYTPT